MEYQRVRNQKRNLALLAVFLIFTKCLLVGNVLKKIFLLVFKPIRDQDAKRRTLLQNTHLRCSIGHEEVPGQLPRNLDTPGKVRCETLQE